MKDIFLEFNAESIKNAGSSLPALIKFNQFASNTTLSTFTFDGSFGNSFMDFTADFTCAPIKPGSDDDVFKEMNNIILNRKNPIFKNSYFTKFILIQIPDYSAQALSSGFSDFIPQVFYKVEEKDGDYTYTDYRKIFQKNIGIMKQYSSRKAWIVIQKDEKYEGKDLLVRIVFKTNVENKMDEQLIKSYKISENSKNGNLYRITFTDVNNFVFSEDLDMYDIYIGNKKIIYPKSFFTIEFEDENDDKILVNKQNFGSIITTDGNRIDNRKEYFRQSFRNDYQDSREEYITKQTEYTITLSFETTEELINKYIKIYSKQHNFNAFYKKVSDVINKNIMECEFNSIRDVMVFDKEGRKLNLTRDGESLKLHPGNAGTILEDSNEIVEIVPEFDSFRKYEWDSIAGITDLEIKNVSLNKILYENYIFPYNTDIERVLCFNKFGSLSYGKFSTGSVILYDSGKTREYSYDGDPEKDNYTYNEITDYENVIQNETNSVYALDTGKDDNSITAYTIETNLDGLRLDEDELILEKNENGEFYLNSYGRELPTYKNQDISALITLISNTPLINREKSDTNYYNLQKNFIVMFNNDKVKNTTNKNINRLDLSIFTEGDILIIENNDDKYIYHLLEGNIIKYCETGLTYDKKFCLFIDSENKNRTLILPNTFNYTKF